MLSKIDLSEEDLKELNKVLTSYKKYDDALDNFVQQLPQLLVRYKKELLIDQLKLMKGGRLGLVFYGYSKKYSKELVLKIIPDFLRIFEIESIAYKNLSTKYMCPVHDVDEINKVIVMERLDNNSLLKYSENKQSIESFFDKVYSNLTLQNTHHNPLYIDVFTKYFDELEKLGINEYDNLKNIAFDLYRNHFNNEELYLIHANLHSNNIMKNDKDYYAIDPLGYVAPKEFTFVRFITAECFFMEGNKEYLHELITFISKYCNYDKLLIAVYIDSVFLLSTLLLQIEDYDKQLSIVMSIVDTLHQKLSEREEKLNEESCDNITKIRKRIFRTRNLYSITC